MLRILLIAALVVVVSCTAEAVADDPATPTDSAFGSAYEGGGVADEEYQLRECITALAQQLVNHNHPASDQMSSGRPGSAGNAAYLNQHCAPFIDTALLR